MAFDLNSLLSSLGTSLYDSSGDQATNAMWGLLPGQQSYGFQAQGQGQDQYQLPPVAGGPTILNPPTSQEVIDPNTIVVENKFRPPSYEEDELVIPNMNNREMIQEAQAALGKAPERRGVFGTKGTLRNILGTLGDAFLVGSGAQPMYAPQRERERLSDAMAGMTQGGQEAMNAIERVAQVRPDIAQEMYNQVAAQQSKAQQMQQAQREAQAKAQEAAIKTFGQFAGSASKETYDRIKPILQSIKARGGLGDEFVIPDTYDESLLNSYRYGAMPAQQQVSTDLRSKTVDQGERRVGIAQQNADANTKRANRPPAGRAAPNPTNASMASQVLGKVERGEALSAGEQEYLNRLGYSPNRGQGSRRSSSPPPSTPASSGSGSGTGTGTGKMVLRNGKWVRQ